MFTIKKYSLSAGLLGGLHQGGSAGYTKVRTGGLCKMAGWQAILKNGPIGYAKGRVGLLHDSAGQSMQAWAAVKLMTLGSIQRLIEHYTTWRAVRFKYRLLAW